MFKFFSFLQRSVIKMNKKKITNLIFNISFFLFKKNVKSNFLHNFQMVDGFRQKKLKKKKIWLKNSTHFKKFIKFQDQNQHVLFIVKYGIALKSQYHQHKGKFKLKLGKKFKVFLLTLTPSPAELLTNSFSESNPVPS